MVNSPPFSWWLRDPVTRASFHLCLAYLVRDREVKLRIYPAMAPMLMLPIAFLFPGSRDPGTGAGDFGIAMTGFIAAVAPIGLIDLLRYSQHWAAGDLFRMTPLPGPASLCHGARLAVLLFVGLPSLGFAAILFLALYRDPAHLALLLPGAIALPVFGMAATASGRAVPLSRPSEEAQSASRTLGLLGLILFSALLAGVAVWTWSMGWFVAFLAAEAVVAAGGYVIARSAASRARWTAWE